MACALEFFSVRTLIRARDRVLFQAIQTMMTSAECPHLQFYDAEVTSLRQAAVIKCGTGATSAQVQGLIQPKTKMSTGRMENIVLSDVDNKEIQNKV